MFNIGQIVRHPESLVDVHAAKGTTMRAALPGSPIRNRALRWSVSGRKA